MADGDSPSDGFGAQQKPAPADVPISSLNPKGGQGPPMAPTAPLVAGPLAGGPEKVTWKTFFAAVPGQLANGLTHLGRRLTQLGAWLARMGHQLNRIGDIKPTPLQKLALLSGLAAAAIVGALAFPGSAIGQACIVALVPGLCIAIGILGTRWHSGQGLNQQLVKATQHAVLATVQLKRATAYVDDRLSAAQAHLENGTGDGALLEVVRAKTATELSLCSAEQAPRQSESALAVSARTRSNQTQPELIGGSVARVEDHYTLIINRGSDHGTQPDMVFAVLADGGDPILDPETGEVLADLPAEKLRVKVIDVQPKYSRAVTFRMSTPAVAKYPALTGPARAASPSADVGSFDFIDESISRMLENELAESIPLREKIAHAKPVGGPDSPVRPEVTIEVGDRVRQVR